MKRALAIFLSLFLMGSITGCSVQKNGTEKIRDIEYTVLEEENVPEEFMTQIKEKEKKVFKLTFDDAGYLYVAIGYGKQPTSGYSIAIKECYETSNAVYVHPNLIGPKKGETTVETETYPYIVIKMESNDKHVVFL